MRDNKKIKITNEEFQRLLRLEKKKLQRLVLKIPDCPRTFRQWNKYKIELKAIKQIMLGYPDVSNDEFEKLIKLNPTTLKFVNNCLSTVPDMLNLLKKNDYEVVFNEYYKRRITKLRETPTNRGRRKTDQQFEQNKEEYRDEFSK